MAQWHSDNWRVLSNLSTLVASIRGIYPPPRLRFIIIMEGNNPRIEITRVDKGWWASTGLGKTPRSRSRGGFAPHEPPRCRCINLNFI